MFENGTEVWWLSKKDCLGTIMHGKVEIFLREYGWYGVSTFDGRHRIKAPGELFMTRDELLDSIPSGIEVVDDE